MAQLKIGMIGLDTSHVPAFAHCLNHDDHPEHIPGGRIVVAYPGGSPDFDVSATRVEGFTRQLREEYGVKMVDTPEDVARAVDLLFIMSCDGRVHPELFKRTVPFKRPTFIDKPFAVSLAAAREMFHLAEENQVPLMSCSSLRYAHTLIEALDQQGEELGAIVGCDVFGPMALFPSQPGLFWYGIHSVEMVNRIMGRGCVQARAATNADNDLITLTFADGRMALVRGLRKAHAKFGCTIHRTKTMQFVNAADMKRSYYATMLEAIMRTLPNGTSDVDAQDTLEIIRIIEAANRSRQTGQAQDL